MRQRMAERIARRDPEREKEAPSPLDDFGYHFPEDYVEDVCWVLDRSSFTFWPKAGGLDDQDLNLVKDVKTYFNLEDRLQYEYDNGEWRGPGDQENPDVPPKFNPLDMRSKGRPSE